MKLISFKSKINYKKNFAIITIMVLSFSVLLVILTMAITYTSINQEINVIEDKNLSKLNFTTHSAFEQVATVAASFSGTSIDVENGSLESYEFLKYSAVNKQLSLCVTMFKYINGIEINNGVSNITKGTISSSISETNTKSVLLGKINGTNIYFNKNYKNFITLLLDPNHSAYTENTVLVSINTYEIGRAHV